MKTAAAALALLCATSQVSGFAPVAPKTQPSTTSLNAWNDQKVTGSLLAAGVVLGSVVSAAPAVAYDDAFDFGSSQVVAGRSGGRAGGRSAGARAAPRPASRSSYSNTRVIERTRYVPTPSYSPGIMVAPPMYNPLPGYGLGLGLNAINQIGNDMRDYRQEGEIRDARSQLEQARMREGELDARLRQLENGGQSPQITQQQIQLLQQQNQELMKQLQLQQAVPAGK